MKERPPLLRFAPRQLVRALWQDVDLNHFRAPIATAESGFQLSPADIAMNARFYAGWERDSHPDGGWNANEKQENYLHLVAIADLTGIPLRGASSLDVRCGTGDLSRFLRDRGVEEYMGVDIYSNALHTARAEYPSENFQELDILSQPLDRIFDYVFCSGALSLRLVSDNQEYASSDDSPYD